MHSRCRHSRPDVTLEGWRTHVARKGGEWAVDHAPVLVDDVGDHAQLAGICSVVDDDNAAHLDVTCESLIAKGPSQSNER
jgi:hypothetical protein